MKNTPSQANTVISGDKFETQLHNSPCELSTFSGISHGDSDNERLKSQAALASTYRWH